MAAESSIRRHGALEVDRVARFQLAQARLAQRFRHHVGGELALAGSHHGKAHTIHRDGIADVHVFEHLARSDDDLARTRAARFPVPRLCP